MAEFTPITTQEQFDAAIGERIRRERETTERKYADYTELKTKVSGYETTIADMTRAAETAAKKQADNDKLLTELQGKVKGYETASVKTRIALETGLPYELAARLSGETEEEIRKDAAALAKYVGKQTQAAPLRSTEPEGTGAAASALRALTNQLTSKGD